jgi:hypothetical protein
MLLILCYLPHRGVPITWARGVDRMDGDKWGSRTARIPRVHDRSASPTKTPRLRRCGASSGRALPGVPAPAPPGSRHPVSLRALMAILQAQRPPYLPSSLEIVQVPPGGAVLRIGYPVPSPLGLLGSGR